jgi:hypothetical protein
MDTLPIFLALAFTAIKVVSTLKNLTVDDTRGGALTQVIVWVVAILGVVLLAEADVTEAYVLSGTAQTLGDLDFAGKCLLGLLVGSTASVIYDFKKAFDSTDSAAEPALFHRVLHRDVVVERRTP